MILLQRGSKGDLVKLLQQEMQDLEVDGDFGPDTENAVIRVQHILSLPKNGIVDMRTLLEICHNPDIRELAFKIAKTQLGESEQPKYSNWGGKVTEYLHSVGIDFPASWCMAFVYWCYNMAADILQVPNPLYKTGGCVQQLQHTSPDFIKQIPQHGDIAIMEFREGHGHTFFVNEVLQEKMTTIEGNSNEDGSPNGYEVVNHERKFGGKIKAYIRVS